MDTTTPNATIRRAAEALNVAAAGAKHSAAGRWYVHTGKRGYPQQILDNAVFIAETLEEPTLPVRLADYIARMDPTVAFGLARLLEAVADADLADIHAAAAKLAVDYLQDKRRCPACDKDMPVTETGALVSHGTMAAPCPGEEDPADVFRCACGAPAAVSVGYCGENGPVLQCVRCATADKRSPFFHRKLNSPLEAP